MKADEFVNESYDDTALNLEHMGNIGGRLVYSKLFLSTASSSFNFSTGSKSNDKREGNWTYKRWKLSSLRKKVRRKKWRGGAGWGTECNFHVAGCRLQSEWSLDLGVCVVPGQSVHLWTFLWESGLRMWLAGRQLFKDGSQMLILLQKCPSESSRQCWRGPV